MKLLSLLVAFGISFFQTLSCRGDIVTVDVFFQGTGVKHGGGGLVAGSLMTVSGEVTIDTEASFYQSVISSELTIERDGDDGYLSFDLPSIPNVGANNGPGDQLKWRLGSNKLFVDRVGDGDSRYGWESGTTSGVQFLYFELGSGAWSHRLNHINVISGREEFVLKEASGIDTPDGFLFSQATGVPEPNSGMVLVVSAWALIWRRKRRTD